MTERLELHRINPMSFYRGIDTPSDINLEHIDSACRGFDVWALALLEVFGLPTWAGGKQLVIDAIYDVN